MPPKDEPKLVKFKGWALRFEEVLENGDVIDVHAVEKWINKLKDGPIGLSFDGRKRVGTVLHLRHFPEGIEAQGLIREDLLSKGRISVEGKALKRDEKDEKKILEWELTEAGWVLAKDDPREKSKGADPKRLAAAENAVQWAQALRKVEKEMDPEPTNAQLANVANARDHLDFAIKEWEKNL